MTKVPQRFCSIQRRNARYVGLLVAVASLAFGGRYTVLAVANSDLVVAIRNADVGMVRRSLARGADPNLEIGNRRNIQQIVREIFTGQRNRLAARTDTPLCRALQIGYGQTRGILAGMPTGLRVRRRTIVTTLLRNGARPNTIGTRMLSPLALALYDGDADLVRILLDRGADPNGSYVPRTARYYLPVLTLAVATNQLDVVEALVSHGADPNVRGSDGSTPLTYAVSIQDVEITRYLIYHKGRVTEPDGDGMTALDHARANLASSPAQGRNASKVIMRLVSEAQARLKK